MQTLLPVWLIIHAQAHYLHHDCTIVASTFGKAATSFLDLMLLAALPTISGIFSL